MEASAAIAARAPGACWKKIGVWGDRSCPELEAAIHCRNCPVYASAGRSLLDRPAPPGYLEEWTGLLARGEQARARGALSAVFFRIGREWLALNTQVFREVVEKRGVHRIPHRSDRVLRGLTNVRGEMRLCASLGDFLELEAGDGEGRHMSHIVYPRMIVVEREGDSWVFPVDEVHGIHYFHADEVRAVPVTLARATTPFTQGLVEWQGQSVCYLDEGVLFYGLRKRLQ